MSIGEGYMSNYEFSIIMAVYNVDKYIEEALESIIKQSFDFSKVQIILVNDGSTDKSGALCQFYKDRYPENIVYIEKENEGTSSARNAGIEVATGRYLNFMDPDDLLERNALEEVSKFFSENEGLKIVTIPLQHFGLKSNRHSLNYKFDKKRIANVHREFNDIVLTMSASFVDRDILGDERFTEGKIIGEDNQLLTKLIMRAENFGLLPDAKYLYRRRSDSAIYSNKLKEDYYFRLCQDYLDTLKIYARENNGEIPKYVQSLVMYEISWKIRQKELPEVVLCRREEYDALILEILRLIDADIINSAKPLNRFQKHAAHSWKDTGVLPKVGGNFYTELKDEKGKLLLVDSRGKTLRRFTKSKIRVDSIGSSQGDFYIGGRYSQLFSHKGMKAILKTQKGKKVKARKFELKEKRVYFLGYEIFEPLGLEFRLKSRHLKSSDWFVVELSSKGAKVSVTLISDDPNLIALGKNAYFYQKECST